MAAMSVGNELVGNMIKGIFKAAEEIAELHACLTSPRGDNFRVRLLHKLEVSLDEANIEELRAESGIREYHRHLNKLLEFGLIRAQEIDDKKQYIRTALGEKAVNALRAFERRVGKEAAKTVYSVSLGPNSIRLFLRVYGHRKKADWERLQIRYKPAEIGRLSLFLPRSVEGISAVDKLNEAEILVYQADNYIYLHLIRARSFYQYLQDLFEIVKAV
ncbi:hypothetical protein ES703_33557 [subsurface metagenome]